ncbi:MAG: GMC family oxidoreductase N-terminal domain-containing protein, partial [Nitriliruptorales bacterium]|nr:GMC family oxidoreductase N-terminal domain-containing protein [Nitriliruptorales bacterium]
NSRAITAVGGGRGRRFEDLPQQQREQILLRWATSPVTQVRAAYQALRGAALIFAYGSHAPHGGPNPRWDAMGFSGPLGPVPNAPSPPLSPMAVTKDLDLVCDVVVVGSGAGGGVAAAVLAEAGLDVVVLEAGPYRDDQDFDGDTLAALRDLYMTSPQATNDQSLTLLAGACVGGGTTINYTTSLPTPDSVREEWGGLGAVAFTSEEYTHSLKAVDNRLEIRTDRSTPGPGDVVLERGARELGWAIDVIPRNVTEACDEGPSCGFCGLGCRLGAKQSTAKTWLVDAANHDARLLADTRAEKIEVTNGRATGVVARHASGRRVHVSARAVVAAAGAIHTPALLLRSGLENPNIGRHLKLHPVMGMFGVMQEDIDPWWGVMQARVVTEHRDLDGAGHGVLFETGPLQPYILAAFSPWTGGAAHAQQMADMKRTCGVAILLRDRDGGEVKVGRDGPPIVRYALSDHDAGHLRTGVLRVAELLEAAGASKVFTSHTSYVGYEPGARHRRDQFAADADAAGWGAAQVGLGSFHIMASARMTGSPATGACDPFGQTWEVDNLVVCDGSAFPTSSGVNPMISIEATAHMNARALAASLA